MMRKRIMRVAVLVALCVACQLAAVDALAGEPATTVLAWFTDAQIDNSVKTKPASARVLPAVPGSYGQGVVLARACPIENRALKQEQGYISFWIKPNWNGNDGKTHRILRVGDPKRNGMLVEKSSKNMLRYVMASPEKITAARADVSGWKAREWHHIVVSWKSSNGGPLGITLWIDRVAVVSELAAGNTFLNPAAPDAKAVWVGDETANAVMDELVMRGELRTELSGQELHLVYRDSFRTAPYARIAVNPEAAFVPSDRRVVAGHEKQFGLLAGTGESMEPVTNFDVRYRQWTDFDAKPFITWSTSDEAIATVDANGMVTGRAVGACTLKAEFRGMTATYNLVVVPVEQADLDLLCVMRLPRYRSDAAKDRPAPGDRVEFVAQVVNYGYRPVPKGVVVRLEYLPDANGNFRLDADETAAKVEERTLDALEPRAEQLVEFEWTWTNEPVWVRVTVDPDDAVPEICEANNMRCELSNARPLHFGYDPKVLEACYTERKINHVGSFCYHDWIGAQKARLDWLVRNAVYDVTSPDGIQDAYRTDKITVLTLGDTRWQDEPWEKEHVWFDGGFPVNEPVNLMAIDAAIMHEFGHTVLALPDHYGYPVRPANVLLRDENGVRYAGTDVFPAISGNSLAMPSAVNDALDVGYNSLMVSCHQWLHPANAGHVQFYRGYRGPMFWGSQGRLLPMREHFLKVYDINDEPLVGAAVYVYHVAHTPRAAVGAKFFADRPKFMGHVDADGRFKFPGQTDKDWDDPDTDEFDGEWPVWNPFGRVKTLTGAPPDTAFTPNVSCVEGLLLLKIVSGDAVELRWLPMTECNVEFFKGNVNRGEYVVRTSLLRAPGETPLVRRPIPEAIRTHNLRPVAVVKSREVTVRCGEHVVIDGSKSTDPERQPLEYRWEIHHRGGARGLAPFMSTVAVYTARTPAKPGEYEAVFYVLDGLRASEAVRVKIHVVQ